MEPTSGLGLPGSGSQADDEAENLTPSIQIEGLGLRALGV